MTDEATSTDNDDEPGTAEPDETGLADADPGDPEAAAVRSARSSNESVPVDESDIEAAQQAMEIANNSPTTGASDPPGGPTPSDR